MLLQSLILKNIRSYRDETIIFPLGTTLLSGDIGSGKSTLLLAIEFALFGASRPDLPAELLLRKGATQGTVELKLKLEEKEIEIVRNLKKEKDTIKQTTGYLTVNHLKKELTPLELKAEIISLLGYPEESLTKNKNYIFRYTVYTPQEEMKLILQEDSEIRLDTLRKIFNMDKYKNVRENLQIYLKTMRMNMVLLKTKTEFFEEKKNQWQQIQEEKNKVENELAQLKPQIDLWAEKIKKQNEELILLEHKQNEFLQWQQKFKTLTALISEKKWLETIFAEQEKQKKINLSSFNFPSDFNLEKIKQEITELESRKQDLIVRQSQLQEKINQTQKNREESKKQIELWQQQINSLPDKEKLISLLNEDLKQKSHLVKRKEELEELLLHARGVITRNETLLQQSEMIKQKISSLDTCPTCFQKVTEDHKHSINYQEDQKIKGAENILLELKRQKTLIQQQKDETKEKIEEMISQENLLAKTKIEREQLQEKRMMLEEKKIWFEQLVQENNTLLTEWEKLLEKDTLNSIKAEINEKQNIFNRGQQKDYLEQQIKEIVYQQNQIKEQLAQLEQQRSLVEFELSSREDLSSLLIEKRKQYLSLLQEEKNLAVQQAQYQTQMDQYIKLEQEKKWEIDELTKQRNRLVQLRELYHWLEDHFLKLTYLIERQVMVVIHRLFNQLFQEWFSLLIEDENISSRIDETFTPIIEQNGYEVSFAYLSGGEKTSAALAYRLALNRVINDIVHQIKTKQILILDEPTDGFSSEQLDKVREVLERLNLRQMILVSHEDKIESFVDNVIRVNKQGHISQIINS